MRPSTFRAPLAATLQLPSRVSAAVELSAEVQRLVAEGVPREVAVARAQLVELRARRKGKKGKKDKKDRKKRRRKEER
jgi:hypothetical protein